MDKTLFLLDEGISGYLNSCNEKIQSYQLIAKIGLPVLKSVILSDKELKEFGENEKCIIINYLKSKQCMLRYLYRNAKHHIKNGGKIVNISKESLLEEREEGADFWLLEPIRREENILSCNISLDRQAENLHLEFLGEGFDISDINKGIVSPHEQIDVPFPICYGAYGEWWKWAQFRFCTEEMYKKSIDIRKDRLKKFGIDYAVTFAPCYTAADRDTIESLLEWIARIEGYWIGDKPTFYNLSCSFQKNGRKICWDIQTPNGKIRAYI